MDTKGFDKFISKLNKDYARHFEDAIRDVSTELLADVKKNTPEDSGRLRRSWTLNREGANIFRVSNNTEYGIHVEYGHRTRSGSVVPGRFMLKKGVLRAKKRVKERLNMELKEIWK